MAAGSAGPSARRASTGWRGWSAGRSSARPGLLVGTGPYRWVSQDANTVHFEAWPGYHGGPAATRYVDFVRAKGDGSDLEAGTVDILPGADLGAAFRATAEAHGVRVVTLPTGGYFALTFNVRLGRLFADRALRQALQLCIDLPRDVDAATGGAGTAIYGPVLPGSWADDPDLPKPGRDVAAAKRLIEAAGWTARAAGIYAKDGVRLAAEILVRGNRDDRVKMADLIASQTRDCGMDVQTRALGDDPYWAVFDYPHDIPGTKTPFDLLLSGWTGGPDPDMASIYASSAITDATHPHGEGDQRQLRRLQRSSLRRLHRGREGHLRPGGADADLPGGAGGAGVAGAGDLPVGRQQLRRPAHRRSRPSTGPST